MTDVVDLTRATYDRVANDYDRRTRVADPAFEEFRDAFAAATGTATATDGPVADLGCGPGRDLLALRDSGLTVIGVDLSSAMLALAASRELPVVQGDLRRPPLRDRSLAGIWSSAAFLHVPREDAAATLLAWHALLMPGGRMALSTSLGGDEGWEVVPYASDGPTGGPLNRWFVHHDREQLVGLVQTAGFQVLDVTERTSHRRWCQVHAVA